MASDPRLIEPTGRSGTHRRSTHRSSTHRDPLPAPTAALEPTAAPSPRPRSRRCRAEPTAALGRARRGSPRRDPRGARPGRRRPARRSRPPALPRPPATRMSSSRCAPCPRRFEDREVLSGIDLTVPRGTILGIIGPSGRRQDDDDPDADGRAQARRAARSRSSAASPAAFRRSERERIGYMPQSFTLYEDLTAGENIDFVASLFGMLWRRRRRRVHEVLKVVDLWDARGRQAGRLSGGMQRRLELACALVHEPELIILDEPTAGIDPLLRGSIWERAPRASATPGGRSSSRPSTSARPTSATRSR